MSLLPRRRHLLLSITIIITIISAAAASTVMQQVRNVSPSAYEMLESYGFPSGLLPEGVTGYQVDPMSGNFLVSLNGTCNLRLKLHRVKLGPDITGQIKTHQIDNIRGVQVQIYLSWTSLMMVKREEMDELEFSVGFDESEEYPIYWFNRSPKCQ